MSSENQSFFFRVGFVIAFCTLLVTASFVGVLAFISGDIQNYQTRVPWYIVIAGLTFVGTIVLLEAGDANGRMILGTAILTTALVFTLVSLAVEGVLFAVENPDRVFVSQLVLYLLSAGLIGTGFGYWALNHWREFSGSYNEERL